MDERLVKAVEIVNGLQDWIDSAEGLSEVPHAFLTWTYCTLSIGIGDMTLWEDQGCSEDDFNLEWLKQEFANHVANLYAIVMEPRSTQCVTVEAQGQELARLPHQPDALRAWAERAVNRMANYAVLLDSLLSEEIEPGVYTAMAIEMGNLATEGQQALGKGAVTNG